jgi:HAE1 family hydrophobic/amphiphilic exporter-1
MQQKDGETFNFALILAGILVYMLMAALFESFTHPLAIMASVPFAFFGVGVALRLANQPRDSLTDLGFIILVGVVGNNAIILVDHINRLRREGLGRDEAILTGGRHRLRATLMTATTTILGLLPMTAPLFLPGLFGSVEGRAGNWAPVGLVILGGLTTSTFLTLVIIPTVYSLIDDFSAFARRVVRAS